MPKSRILLAVHHQGNRRVMAEWLSDQYEVIISNLVEYVPDKVDLCIVDYSLFQNSTANLLHYKKIQYPKFAPVLLIMPRNSLRLDVKQLGTLFDEFITTPIEKRSGSIDLNSKLHFISGIPAIGYAAILTGGNIPA